MDLDNIDRFRELDKAGVLGHIDGLPDHLEAAFAHALSLPVSPSLVESVTSIVICGMGGSAISGDLFAALVGEECRLPVFVNRGYGLPAHAAGRETLVIAMSHSGTTEETLSAVSQAAVRGCRVMGITTGGDLPAYIEQAGGTVVSYQFDSPPRAAIGWLYGLLLGVMFRCGLVGMVDEAIAEALEVLRRNRQSLGAERQATRNRAKQVAGNLAGCLPVIWGAGLMEPVARRWKTQINENAKSPAYVEAMPELNHNSVVGIERPLDLIPKLAIVQLVSKHDHPRNAHRHRVTHRLLLREGILTEVLEARGSSRLAQQLAMVQLGDYVSYYLAMAYEVDPGPIGPIEALKEALADVDE